MEKEELLIEKACKGDKRSFERIINLYKNYIFAIILSFIKNYEEAENISQEVFLQIYISLPKFQEDNFKAWISRIATNKSIDYLRKKRSRVKEEKIDYIESIDINPRLENIKGPESLLLDKEKKEDIKKQIDSLPTIYKKTIIKFYLEEKSYKEIAREEDLPIKTIESRLYRGRQILKKNWRKKDDSL
ncbi:MAG: RNA polymerase sigma factor [Tissierella sp.]|uniref:RNA polymerase sigma factor n=1 Tax=Tissierella sp. TaxID=41274 RepID=UPI003F94345E